MPAPTTTFDKTDWKLLMQQKHALIEAIDGCKTQFPLVELLDGLLQWLDSLQDEAVELGYPVVFDEEVH